MALFIFNTAARLATDRLYEYNTTFHLIRNAIMRRFFALLIIILLAAGLTVSDASAKRFGGGRSFGMQRNTSSFTRPSSPLSAPAQRPANRWLGPLAGFAMGGLLASLFMGHGIGSGMLSWIIVALVLTSIIGLIRSRMRTSPQSNYSGFRENLMRDTSSHYGAENPAVNTYAPSNNMANNMGHYPVGFDMELFLRDAKVQFIRLQTAYDQKNLNDLRKFTTPEVFGEIQLQLQERGDDSNQTEVVTLNAQLLNAITEPQTIGGSELQAMLASVHFSGLIREDASQVATAFNETWHFRKEVANQQWTVAGIQQTH
jgi:predicted lipid-binding transport protein (Tim44 family)